MAAPAPTADAIARWVGIDYPPAFYLLLCLFVTLLLLFHLSPARWRSDEGSRAAEDHHRRVRERSLRSDDLPFGTGDGPVSAPVGGEPA
ncbi:MAG: hypothetical protein R3E12_14350 [Candidatus Eisenbacteria bacterium]